jgi:hypothetical protein
MDYQYIIVPLLAAIIAQVLKMVLQKKYTFAVFTSYGGMPSSHTAIVTALTALLGLHQGLASPLFAIAFIFSIITVRDVLGVRRKIAPGSEHTVPEVVGGAVLGVALALLGSTIT